MKLLLACGGTGGHFFPAIGLAEVFLHQYEPVIVIGESSVEQELSKDISVRIERIPVFKIPNGSAIEWLSFLKEESRALVHSIQLIRKIRPEIVIGFGGYAAVPTLLAAKLCGVPTLIHEQNVLLGKANRFLARWSNGIALSFPATATSVKKHACVAVTGNPGPLRFRNESNAGFELSYPPLLEEGRFTLLVMGGSQGAHRVNECMVSAVCGWLHQYPEQKKHLQLIHVTGAGDYQRVYQAYKGLDIPFLVTPFHTRMDQFYRLAHLVVARAGATSLAELAFFGLPSFLIPYPHAGAHQLENAEVFEREGAGVVIQEGELSIHKIVEYLQLLAGAPEKLHQMKIAAERLAILDVKERFTGLIEKVKFGFRVM